MKSPLDLKSHFGKTVEIVAGDGSVYTGKVGDFIEGKYNEPSYEDCIILDNLVKNGTEHYKWPVQFNRSEIVKIKIL